MHLGSTKTSITLLKEFDVSFSNYQYLLAEYRELENSYMLLSTAKEIFPSTIKNSRSLATELVIPLKEQAARYHDSCLIEVLTEGRQ
jgi:hypothetical protein